MKKLFLTSYFAGTVEAFKEFEKGNVEGKRVTFIPTAGNVEEYTGYIEEARELLAKMGYEVDSLDISSLDEKTLTNRILESHFLYVSGGNTFYLLQEIKKKNLVEVMRRMIENGIPYVGESAGAIITAPNIEYNQLMDDKEKGNELKSYESLGIVDFYVVPHYKEFPFEESAELTLRTYKENLALKPLNNSEAIIVIGNNCRVVGK